MKPRHLLPFLFIFLLSCTPQDVLTDSRSTGDELVIAFAEPISSYSPLSYESKNRNYLVNIYEPLVRFDATFNYESSLAVSWGRLSETVWDFHLREDVLFHDGTSFDADDVLYSIQLAREYEGSELDALLSTIISVEKKDSNRIQITTANPDPLLLNKLSYVLMVPSAYENFNIPNGTGPYRAVQFVDDALVLERFDAYWGPVAYFENVKLKSIASPEERIEALLSGEVDVLGDVPPQGVESLRAEGIRVEDYPSLENSFLILNLNGPFSDPNLRRAVWWALGTDYAEQLGGDYLFSSSQVAATGITGYNALQESRQQDLDEARLARALLPETILLTLDIPEGLEALGEEIVEDLALIDITVTVNTIAGDDYEEFVKNGLSDFYFFGWKYDLADSEDFFSSVIHTPVGTYGEFNFFAYSNPSLDARIEDLATVFDPGERGAQLSELSVQLAADQVVLPLFESQTLYGLSDELYYDFRLDGLIWASEIIENVVE